MKEKFLPIVSGFILTLLVIILAIFFFSKPNKIETNPSEFLSGDTEVQELKNVVKELNNFGDLPRTTDSGSQGRSNPFDSY
ncbi:MAG: hypothetical protein ABH810_02900 [bacterium]